MWLANCNLVIWEIYLDKNRNINLEDKEENISLIIFKNLISMNHYFKCITEIEGNKIINVTNIQDINKINIKRVYLEIFITLLVDNAINHGILNGDITLEITGDIIKIKNQFNKDNINCAHINKNLYIEPWKLINNKNLPGITLYTINKYLNYINYNLKTTIENNLFVIQIKLKDNK